MPPLLDLSWPRLSQTFFSFNIIFLTVHSRRRETPFRRDVHKILPLRHPLLLSSTPHDSSSSPPLRGRRGGGRSPILIPPPAVMTPPQGREEEEDEVPGLEGTFCLERRRRKGEFCRYLDFQFKIRPPELCYCGTHKTRQIIFTFSSSYSQTNSFLYEINLDHKLI